MKNYKQILFKSTSLIKEVLYIIDTGAMKIAIVIDKNKKPIGVLTNCDIRKRYFNV